MDNKNTAPERIELRPMRDAPRDNETHILLKTTRGWVEGWFARGEWSEHHEYGPEYNGSVWVCADDTFQLEVEEMMSENGSIDYLDSCCEGWLPLPDIAAMQPVASESDEKVRLLELAKDYVVEVSSCKEDADLLNESIDALLARHRQKPAEVSRTAEKLAARIKHEAYSCISEHSASSHFNQEVAEKLIQAALTEAEVNGARRMQASAKRIATEYVFTYEVESAISALDPHAIIKGGE